MGWDFSAAEQNNTPWLHCFCVILWQLWRETDSRDRQTKHLWVYACICVCGFLHTCLLWRALALAHTQNHTGNWAETCRVTGVCLALPLSFISFPSPYNPRLFLESSEMRESNYSVRCQRVSGWMRERERVGRWRVKLREVKKSQRVDQTLGVRREGRKEGRQQGTKGWVEEGMCRGRVHGGIYGENKGREVEVKLTREEVGENRMAWVERGKFFFVAACTFLFVHAHIRKKQIQRYTEHKWMRIACVCTLGLSHWRSASEEPGQC